MTVPARLTFLVGIVLGIAFWITFEPVLGILAFVLLVLVTPWPDETEP